MSAALLRSLISRLVNLDTMEPFSILCTFISAYNTVWELSVDGSTCESSVCMFVTFFPTSADNIQMQTKVCICASSPPLLGLSPGVPGASSGEAAGGGGAESSHDHPGSHHRLPGQVGASTPQQPIPPRSVHASSYCSFLCTRRKQYRKLLQCIVVIQKNYRAFYWRRKFLLLRWAALTFQKRLRGQLARRAFGQLLEDKRRQEEEERRRRAEEEMER